MAIKRGRLPRRKLVHSAFGNASAAPLLLSCAALMHMGKASRVFLCYDSNGS